MDQYYRLFEVVDHQYSIQLNDELIKCLEDGIITAKQIILFLLQDERITITRPIEMCSLASVLVDGKNVLGAYIDTKKNTVHLKY